MRKSMILLGLFFSIALIACSDDDSGGGVPACPAGYVYTTNQTILNMVYNNQGTYGNNPYSQYPNYNQYPNNNQYQQYPNGQNPNNGAVVNQYCVSQQAYNYAQQQLNNPNGQYTGGGNYGNIDPATQQYCTTYVNDVINSQQYAWLNDPQFTNLQPAYRDYFMQYCIGQCMYGACTN